MEKYIFLDSIDTKEESLVTAFEHYLTFNLDEDSLIMKELDCWQGRADIVKVKFNQPIKINIKKAQMISNLTYAKIISILHYKAPRTFHYIKSKTGYSDSTIKKSIKKLIENNIIQMNENGSYLLHPSFVIPNVSFDAYEAKLSNWKRALYQALQYRGFANTSSVVMPSKYVDNALQYKEGFIANGIGLVEVRIDGQVKIHIKPKKLQPSRKEFYLVGVGKFLQEFNFKYGTLS